MWLVADIDIFALSVNISYFSACNFSHSSYTLLFAAILSFLVGNNSVFLHQYIIEVYDLRLLVGKYQMVFICL